jgi:hypothetical protein
MSRCHTTESARGARRGGEAPGTNETNSCLSGTACSVCSQYETPKCGSEAASAADEAALLALLDSLRWSCTTFQLLQSERSSGHERLVAMQIDGGARGVKVRERGAARVRRGSSARWARRWRE